jgi:SAM-dependent methyltransferase
MMTDPKITSARLDCPSCESQEIDCFHEISNVPVNSVMNCYSREAALAFPRGEISLGFCRNCGFIFNTRFDSLRVRYSSECEESQGYSATFNAFAKQLALDLVKKYQLYQKRIIEIGCGKGEFLKYLCALGRNTGVGFDPAFVPGRSYNGESLANIEFIKDYYSDAYSGYQGDLICCRMTLEHLFEPAGLIRTVRRSIADRRNTVVFFQVPDVTRIMKDCAFEDIYYEHCSYFSPGSLARLFQRHDFDIVDLQKAYDDQYILLEAKPTTHPRDPEHPLGDRIDALAAWVAGFKTRYPGTLRYWQIQLERLRQRSQKVVVWGGGSKGCAFLNALEGSTVIDYVVDIHPFRQQTYMAGTGQRIVAPAFLTEYRPDIVIVMNAIYRAEIQSALNQLGLTPLVTTLAQRDKLGD